MARERCVLAGRAGHVCSGKVQWHHPIKQQRIRDRFPHGAWRELPLDGEPWKSVPRGGIALLRSIAKVGQYLPKTALLGDPRNRIWACWDAHQAIEGDVRNLPEPVWEFAREFGLDAALENDVARQR